MSCRPVKRYADSCRKNWTDADPCSYARWVDYENGRPPDAAQPACRHVTINQVIAWNMAYFRRAAGITQEELGELIGGRPKTAVSADERSWDGKRTREFDAEAITVLAAALGVPVLALFLPPEDDGITEHYVYGSDGESTMTDLMRAVVPDTGYDTPVMDAYRKRLDAAVTYYADPGFAAQVARFLRDATDGELRADRAARIRQRQAELEAVAGELADIAGLLEHPEAGQ